MFTILHTADVHLDRAFSGVGMTSAIASARRQELRDAFRRFIDLALETRADAVTIGGDLYEHERLTLDTGNFLRQQFGRLGSVPVLVAAGNHDPYLPDSLYRRIDWPPNVTIFGEPRFRAVALAPGITIWGAGHDGPSLRDNLVGSLRVAGDGVHLLLFHGSDVQSVPEGKSAHCPFRAEEIAASGAHFALLGHYHAPRIGGGNRSLFAYPGSPEPLDFSEDGEHCVLRLEIDGGEVRPQLLPFGRVRYRTHHIDVTGMITSEEVRSAIASQAEASAIGRIVLAGDLQPEVDLDISALYNSCAETFAYLEIVDRTRLAYDLDELAEESTTKGAFVRLLRTRIDSLTGGEREIAERALVAGLRAFEGRTAEAL